MTAIAAAACQVWDTASLANEVTLTVSADPQVGDMQVRGWVGGWVGGWDICGCVLCKLCELCVRVLPLPALVCARACLSVCIF